MGSFAPHGHAQVDPQRPSAFAICDQCGFLFNRSALRWETEYYGKEVRRTGHLVCNACFNLPNPTLRPVKLPADPDPVWQPRSEPTFYGVITADMIKYTADSDLYTADNWAPYVVVTADTNLYSADETAVTADNT